MRHSLSKRQRGRQQRAVTDKRPTAVDGEAILRWAIVCLLMCLGIPGGQAEAQWSPAQPMTIVAPANPGGGWDQTARFMQLALEKEKLVGTAVEVENRGGAGGTIALAELAENDKGNANKLMITGFGMTGAVLMHGSRHSLIDVTPIARLTSEYLVIAVPPSSPFKTFEDFAAALRADPRKISWGGGPMGSADHIFSALLAEKLKIDPSSINYVAFTGGGEAAAAVLGGQVSVGVSGYGEWQALAAAGRIRLLAISSPARSVSASIRTLREIGISLDFANWRGIVAPSGLSPGQRTSLIAMISKARSSATWQRVVKQNEWQDSFLSGDHFEDFVRLDSLETQRILSRMGMLSGRGSSTAVGAYFFPGIAATGMFVSLIFLGFGTGRVMPTGVAGRFVSAVLDRRAHDPRTANALISVAPLRGNAERVPDSPIDLKRFCAAVAGLAAYATALATIGFLFTTPVFIVLLARLVGSRALLRDSVAAAAMTVSILILFQNFLGVKLP